MRNGTRLVGWYLPPNAVRRPPASSAALLWFYGNGETIGAIWPTIRDFRPPNAALLVLDYPGYGVSEGHAGEAAVYEAADLGYQELLKRPQVDRHRRYVYGRSLVSAVATHLPSTHDVPGLMLAPAVTSLLGIAVPPSPVL